MYIFLYLTEFYKPDIIIITFEITAKHHSGRIAG